jgi:8-oxo-dGTP pyrophosphatase MutT (NUDIX family)
MRNIILQIIESIKPFDTLEAEHLLNAVKWIQSGEEIFRLEKPAIPPRHLVSYFVLIDPSRKKILLVDHIKAGLWLPSGGHIEKDEHPAATVEREILEELNCTADFLYPNPIFLTETVTVGKTAGHIDVSLWYALKADSQREIMYDTEEFNGYKWFDYNEILDMEISRFDPHMHRFTKKLFMHLELYPV